MSSPDGPAIFQRRQPFLIAEVSCNHIGRRDVLSDTVAAAFAADADAVKLQSSEPECLTRDFDGPEFFVNAPGSPWHGTHLWTLYERTCTPTSWPIEEIQKARRGSQLVFSTPFSPRMVELLETQAQPELYKVSSIDWNYLELIERCLDTGKPVLISLVKPSTQLQILRDLGFDALVPMYCVSRYPATPKDFNIDELKFLARECPGGFGFSDHSLGPALVALAVAHGATIIEKHFKLNDQIQSDDAHFSATPDDFALVARVCHDVYVAGRSQTDQTTIPIGRSVYLDRDIEAGDVISREHLCVIRPGGGLDATELNRIIGRKATMDLKRGLRLQERHVE